MDHSMARALRRRVLFALAANRRPGFHFPGYLLGVTWPQIGPDTVVESIAASEFTRDASGNADMATIGVLVDTTLATAARLKTETGARQATVQLHAQFTGRAACGDLRMEGRLEGFSVAGSARQALTRGVMFQGDEPVCYATGTFVVLPPPPGARLGPLPWQERDAAPATPLAPAALDDRERAVVRACNAALRRADDRHAFIEHFWGMLPKPHGDGARLKLKIAPQHANRVGHVQGGLSFALAMATAQAAVPRHAMLSNISAWYISPGQGRFLSARARVIHAGRSFAVVRTEIRNADRSLVLGAVSNHAA